MDKRLKFRGKHIKSNEWVYGYAAQLNAQPYCDECDRPYTCIITGKVITQEVFTGEVSDSAYITVPECIEVNIETLGQNIGRTDIDGLDLYVGDLCTAKGFASDVVHEIVFIDGGFGTITPNCNYVNDINLFYSPIGTILKKIGDIHSNKEYKYDRI